MPSMKRDVLGGRPAKPETIVPGHWILPLPSSSDSSQGSGSIVVTHLRVRRFREKSQAGDGVDPKLSPSEVWEKLGDGALDEAWRAISNSRTASSSSQGKDNVLREKLATIVSALPASFEAGTADQGKGSRELWCLSLSSEEGDFDLSGIEELDEITPPLGPFDIADCLSCKSHGSALSCLDATPPCDVSFAPSREMGEAWGHLTNAVAERMAWNAGRRISMSANSISNPPLNAILRPYTPTSMLLTLTPTPLPSCKPSPSPSPLHAAPRPSLLLPLRIPAISLAPFTPTPPQATNLSSVFDEILGPKWREGARAAKLRSSISNRAWSDWSILWVPTLPPSSDYAKVGGQELVGQWQRGEGILTIWPTHLLYDLSPAPFSSETTNGNGKKRKAESTIAYGAPIPKDILGWSANVFDVLGAYKEPPPPPPPEPIADGGAPLRLADLTPEERLDGVSPEAPTNGDVGDGGGEGEGGGEGSDLEDLFSSHSSPAPSSPVVDKDLKPPETNGNGEINLDDLFEAPPAPADHAPMQLDEELLEDISGEYGGDDGGFPFPGLDTGEDLNLVTEDDFAFFDSPTQAMDDSEAAIEVPGPDQSPEEAIEPIEMSPKVPTQIPDTSTAEESHALVELAAEGDAAKPPADIGAAEDEHTGVESSPPAGAGPVEVAPPSPPASPPASTPPSPKAAPPAPKRRITSVDLIPSQFEPLPLQSSKLHIPRISYLPPSPAPSPESLRSDLIDRLRSSKTAKVDYASSWRFEDDSSNGEADDEEEGEFSGAPPTPASTEWDPESRASMHDGAPLREDGEEIVLYGGVRCVSAEWIGLAGEASWRDALGRSWNSSWGKAYPARAASPPVKTERVKELEKLDVDRLALEIVWNTSFRRMLLPSSPSANGGAVGAQAEMLEMAKSGVALADLSSTDDEADPPQTKMPDCNIHTGFNNNILRVSAGALGYWKQLGLGPAGGKKDLVPMVLCEASESSKRAALVFLKSLGATYESLGLGKHAPEEAVWEKAVVGVQAADFPKTLESQHQKLVALEGSGDERYHIIYVLFNQMTAALSPSAIQLLFSSSGGLARPSSGLHLIQVVSASSIHPSGLSDLAFGVYNRFPRQIETIDAHGHPIDDKPKGMQFPSWTLAPDKLPKVDFSMTWPLRSYDLLNRWRWTHAAYGISPELGQVVAVVIDSEGENLELKTWRWTPGEGVGKALEGMWEWMQGLAKAAAVEWRISIARVGSMGAGEYDAWRKIMDQRHYPISLVVAVLSPPTAPAAWNPRPPLSNITPAIFNDPATRLHDDTLTAYYVPIAHRLAVSLPSSAASASSEHQEKEGKDVYATKSFILSMANGSSPGEFTSSTYHILHSRSPPPPAPQEKVEEVLSREYQKLAVLGRLRFGWEGSGVPCHMDAVRSVLEGLAVVAQQQG